MKTADRPGLKVQFDTHHCQMTPTERDICVNDLAALERQVADFPVCDLHVLFEFNSRSNDFSVKTTLILPGATLVGSDHDTVAHTAFMRCLTALVENVRAYKERMGQVPELHHQQKGTSHEVAPLSEPDFAAMDLAVKEGDYGAFRTATLPYEEAVRKRAGRWVERLPAIADKMGGALDIGDLVEAVFLEAFDGYASRPREVRFGDWFVGLIDPAVKALNNGGAYLENVRLARSANEAVNRG